MSDGRQPYRKDPRFHGNPHLFELPISLSRHPAAVGRGRPMPKSSQQWQQQADFVTVCFAAALAARLGRPNQGCRFVEFC